MWEVLDEYSKNLGIYGITPTYVGSTDVMINAINTRQDHPHVCGKYTKRSQ